MPKNVDHDAYRLELAQKAARLFSKQGFAGLGMRSIAKELGISKSALNHYFPTKKGLLLAPRKSQNLMRLNQSHFSYSKKMQLSKNEYMLYSALCKRLNLTAIAAR
jgi:predicted transcriptional regulator